MKFKILSIIILAGLVFTACSDYLKVLPVSAYSVEGSYKTQADYEQAIAGVYAQQQNLYSSNTCWFYGMITRSDETTGSGYVNGIDKCMDDPTGAWSLTQYRIFWKMINRCNIILDKIDQATFTNSTYQNNIKGEAYILRAFAYWNLGYLYGGMPILDKNYTISEIRTIKRSTQAETFSFAEADYKKAMEMLPENWTGTNLGRATKYAAMGMLARLYMFQSKFSDAQSLLSTVIASNKFAMATKYEDCYLDSKDNGPERVWEVQYTGGQLGEGTTFITGLLPETFKNTAIQPFPGFSTALIVCDSLYSAYEKGDLRRNISILKGYNNNGVQDTVSKFIVKYTRWDTYKPLAQGDWANNLPILRYTDVVMMNVEALNEIGYSANGVAFTQLNSVRARAGLRAYTTGDLPDQASFRKAVRQERRFEFAFEGLRWMDILRWGIATEVKNTQFSWPQMGSGLLYHMDDFRKIFPIPYEDIVNYNDANVMWQNPKY